MRARPVVLHHLAWVRDAYLLAASARPFVVDHGAQYPMGLPPTEIKAVLDVLGVPRHAQADAFYLIQRIDQAFLTYVEEGRKKAKKERRR